VQELAGNKWSGTAEKYIKVKSKNERELINLYFPSILKKITFIFVF
jgi:hypothetical protein